MKKLIKGKKLIDGKGSIINNPEIIIDDNYIKDVGERGKIKIPENIEIIDLKNHTILPGLIDAHVHTFGSDISTDPEFIVADRGFNNENDIFRVARSTNELKNTLFAGFTTICDGGSNIGPDLSNVLEQEIIPGPRLYSPGNFISSTYGTFDQIHWPLEALKDKRSDMIADGISECIAIVRRRVRSGAKIIKIGTSACPAWEKCENRANANHPNQQILTFTLNEVKTIVDTAHQLQVKVHCHAIGDEAVRLAAEGGVDVIVHGQGIKEETRKLILQKKIIMVPTLMLYYLPLKWGIKPGIGECFLNSCKTHFDYTVRDYKENFKTGIKIALGTDLWTMPYWPLGENSLGLELLVSKIGMTPEQAITAATINAAEAIGVDKYIGSVETGKFADIISVNNDPLKDIKVFRDVNFVMKNGKIFIKDGLWMQGIKRKQLLPNGFRD